MHTIHVDAGMSFGAHPKRTAELVKAKVIVPFSADATDTFRLNPKLTATNKAVYIALLDVEGVFA